jgi:hypothetical protein
LKTQGQITGTLKIRRHDLAQAFGGGTGRRDKDHHNRDGA